MSEALIRHRLDSQVDRVREHTSQRVNQRITRTIQQNVERCIREGRDSIISRLSELDREWDIDRVVMANFALIGGAAYAGGLERYSHPPLFGRRRKGLLYLVGAQIGFLMMHAAIGWCPPVAVWRRFGVRTKAEIEVERAALLAALEEPHRHESHHHTEGKPALKAPPPQISS
jgi:hypothetical protein